MTDMFKRMMRCTINNRWQTTRSPRRVAPITGKKVQDLQMIDRLVDRFAEEKRRLDTARAQ